MNLKSARQAWSDAYYTRWDSVGSLMMEHGQVGIAPGSGYIRKTITEVGEDGKPCRWNEYIYCPAIKQDRTGLNASIRKAAHQALAGHVQKAIGTLRPEFQAFGHHLYSPLATIDNMETAEALVWQWFESRRIYRGWRMTATKREKAMYVSRLCLHRYRRLNQGGQGEGIDPVPTAELFRQALDDVYGVELSSQNWSREWEPLIQLIDEACNDIDKQVLAPISELLTVMKNAA